MKASFATPLLDAVLSGRVEKASLTSFHVRQMRNLGDERVNELVTRVWGQARDTTADAKARLAALSKTYNEAPLWAYDARAGREVYDKACATCHALEDRERKPGPDLAGSGRNGVEYFLESVLDPNAVVGEDYQLTVVLKIDGTVISGLIQEERADALTIRTVDETVVVSLSEIAAKGEAGRVPDAGGTVRHALGARDHRASEVSRLGEVESHSSRPITPLKLAAAAPPPS